MFPKGITMPNTARMAMLNSKRIKPNLKWRISGSNASSRFSVHQKAAKRKPKKTMAAVKYTSGLIASQDLRHFFRAGRSYKGQAGRFNPVLYRRPLYLRVADAVTGEFADVRVDAPAAQDSLQLHPGLFQHPRQIG